MSAELKQQAQHLAGLLRSSPSRVVFAESCTGGLVSATLAQVPGISEFHCGSAVVYRLDTKTKWLGIAPDLLIHPGPVSEVVARQMALSVLQQTPEADWSAAITGHLGPDAPQNMDGLVFLAVARRDAAQPAECTTTVQRHELGDPIPAGMTGQDSLRERRQVHAAGLVLAALRRAIEDAH